ncbi:hypothetical protein [Streptococcus bovimastitidis]|nr:hypothetical protein [Streptococcus bovimastitidis]
MKKEYISYLSAAIFIIYGLSNHKMVFLILGFILILIGLADRLKK